MTTSKLSLGISFLAAHPEMGPLVLKPVSIIFNSKYSKTPDLCNNRTKKIDNNVELSDSIFFIQISAWESIDKADKEIDLLKKFKYWN